MCPNDTAKFIEVKWSPLKINLDNAIVTYY